MAKEIRTRAVNRSFYENYQKKVEERYREAMENIYITKHYIT